MRIIAGKYGGLRIKAKVPTGVRPTADNVRESIFGILSSRMDFEGVTVLDICAGTGAMGFEAISRGAESIVFIEKSKKVSDFIKIAAETFKISPNKYNIINADALTALKRIDLGSSVQFDIIFFDPPYESEIYNPVIDLINKRKVLKSDGIFIVESSVKYALNLADSFKIDIEKKYGEKKASFLISADFAT